MSAPAKKPSVASIKVGKLKSAPTRRVPSQSASVAKDLERKHPKRHRATDPDEQKSSVLTVRLHQTLKTDATSVLRDIGISLPEAIRVFLSRVVSERGFPFRLEAPNAVTRAAMQEARTLSGQFATTEELFDDLEKGGRG